MAQVEALLTSADRTAFAAWLVDEYQARFVVDDDALDITESHEVSAIASALERTTPPTIFVLSDHWTFLPLCKAPAHSPHKGDFHFVCQRVGGPAFGWLPGNTLPAACGVAYSASLIWDHPSFYVELGTTDAVRRPPSMSRAMRSFQRWFCRRSQGLRALYREGGTTGPWVSAQVAAGVGAGRATLANPALEVPSGDA